MHACIDTQFTRSITSQYTCSLAFRGEGHADTKAGCILTVQVLPPLSSEATLSPFPRTLTLVSGTFSRDYTHVQCVYVMCVCDMCVHVCARESLNMPHYSFSAQFSDIQSSSYLLVRACHVSCSRGRPCDSRTSLKNKTEKKNSEKQSKWSHGSHTQSLALSAQDLKHYIAIFLLQGALSSAHLPGVGAENAPKASKRRRHFFSHPAVHRVSVPVTFDLRFFCEGGT